MQKDNVQRPSKGLHQDSSTVDQPQGTYRFALNAVNETELGDFAFISNEESNQICDSIPINYIPLGKVYLSGNETAIFLVKEDETASEIGILDDNCNYTTYVNDADSDDKLNFKVSKQIQATYRLRRGCERTVYFTDDFNKPKYFNFDKPEDFKDNAGDWSGRKFNLFKDYNSIPGFQSVEVLDSGGILEPGSYNISVQYLDEGLNATEWITTSPVINIYNDLSTEDFLDIRGSINSDTDYMNFPPTSKAIKVTLDSLDESFAFYRLGFIEANNGSGQVSGVKYSEVIPISKNFYIYTGENAASQGTVEEIAFFNEIIYKAQSIEQIENRLILGNTQGKQVNYCLLQRYASRIKADVVTQKVILNQHIDPRNPKNPTMQFGDMITGGLGYMPGEIYSFGIIYIFEDGSQSPVFHIPGKSPTADPQTIYSPGANTYPMSINNQSLNSRYIDNDSCISNNYWGLDSEGDTLEGKFTRHHRFPFRSEIGIPLVQEEGTSTENEFQYYQLKLFADGTIVLPEDCPLDPDTGEVTVCAPPFVVKITYTVNGEQDDFSLTLDPSTLSNPVNEQALSNLYTSNDIVVIKIEESADGITYTEVPAGTTSPKGLVYTTEIADAVFTSETKIYSSQILGIKFSGVDIPTLEDTNGEAIIGYYIVRNERIENEKTILDSAVLTPTLKNDKYISTGLLQPETSQDRIQKDVFGLIYPENKFNNREYSIYDYIKQEGNFDIIKRDKSKIRYNDVYDGTSFDPKAHKSGNDDGHDADGVPGSRGLDGWCLEVIARDNYLSYRPSTTFNIPASDIEDTFYLKALESRNIELGARTIYNIASDNRIGIVQLEEEGAINTTTETLPYVVIGRDIADNYSNFRLLPYYKQSINIQSGSTATVFSGDSYVAPMRYVNTVFWENRVAKRAGRTSILNYILGGALIAIGAVLTFFTAGASTLVIGAGISIIGGGALFLASGIERDAMVRAYEEAYGKGLRETALDNWVSGQYRPAGDGINDGPSDDAIQWIGESLTDLWFDTSVNTHLRHGMITDAPTFLDAPGIYESGNQNPRVPWHFFDRRYELSTSRYPVSKLEYHLANKLTVYDSSRNDNRLYLGAALGEYYEINPDYHRYNKQKLYYHLPLEYDCCTDCMEDFPHRVHYSEQSFQEELTDNYRVFLPNNYRDIEGETGEIKNIFRIGNNLFIHTLEGLWQLPKNYQERVTDEIVSFIGTGDFFSVPPQKVLDDDTGSSAGIQHKWSAIKTPSGYFFVCENQRKVYQFDGRSLKPISNAGLSNWFKEHTRLNVDQQYYNTTGRKYPYSDNPSNIFGSGFISTYDTKKERLIFSKKDYTFSEEVAGQTGYELCVFNGQVTIFPNYQNIIDTEAIDNWGYVGLENCRMKFRRDVIRTRTETREVRVTVPNTAHIYVFYDTSGSFNTGTYLADLRTSVESWYSTFRPDDIGQTRLHHINNATEHWINFANIAAADSSHTGDILVISLCNEASPINNTTLNGYHGLGLSLELQPSARYILDYNQFVSTTFANLNSFVGINYPIATIGAPYLTSKGFIQQSLLAMRNTYTTDEINGITKNEVFSDPEWDTVKGALAGTNPYTILGPGLETYNWIVKPDRNDLAVVAGTQDVIITPEQFSQDINDLLESIVTVVEVEVEVEYLDTEYKYIDGTVVEDPVALNNSWTLSYSLKQDAWISWHSYLPQFYINVPEKFYSWVYGNNNIWVHNKVGNYQTFYNTYYPHILEYVSLSSPVTTRFWNHIRLMTETKIYNPALTEYTDDRYTTFNKLIAYNSRQCSGLLNLKVKDKDYDQQDWFANQVINTNDNDITIDRAERDWLINDLRDIRVNYDVPVWNSSIQAVQNTYPIDKVLNVSSLSVTKDWTQLESFRDKYLVIRLIFDNFAGVSNKKLITNYSVENEQQSFR